VAHASVGPDSDRYIRARLGQVEGGPKEKVRPGDIVWFPPGEKHWHGATSTTVMTHSAIAEGLPARASIGWRRLLTNRTGPDERERLGHLAPMHGLPAKSIENFTKGAEPLTAWLSAPGTLGFFNNLGLPVVGAVGVGTPLGSMAPRFGVVPGLSWPLNFGRSHGRRRAMVACT
jgi:hypothetical protein